MHRSSGVLKTVDTCLEDSGIPTYTELREELVRLHAELEQGKVASPRFRRTVFNCLSASSSLSKLLLVEVNGIAVPPERRKEALEQAERLLGTANMASYACMRDALGQAAIELERGRLSNPKAWRKRLSALLSGQAADNTTDPTGLACADECKVT